MVARVEDRQVARGRMLKVHTGHKGAEYPYIRGQKWAWLTGRIQVGQEYIFIGLIFIYTYGQSPLATAGRI